MNTDLRSELDDAILSCSKGNSYDFFKFAATHVTTLGNGPTEQTFEADCFTTTTMVYTKIDSTSVQIEINAQNPSSELCSVNQKNVFFC